MTLWKEINEFILNFGTGIKQFSCDVCAKTFSQKGNLKVHMTVHEENRPQWTCSYCGRAYGFKSNYTKHVKTVHAAAEERRKRKTIQIESPREVEHIDESPKRRKRKRKRIKTTSFGLLKDICLKDWHSEIVNCQYVILYNYRLMFFCLLFLF